MASESFIQQLFAERIGGNQFGKDTKVYKFEKIKIAKKEAIKNNPGKTLIDLGVGEPDEMAFPEVVRRLVSEVNKPENRGYADNGIDDFKDAAAQYMEKVFGVKGLNPKTEINHAIGSKPALAMIPAMLINPGDYILMTVPGYPVSATHSSWYGGKVHNLELTEENNFLPDLDSVPEDIAQKAKILYINYPNNPTGAGATVDFYQKVIAFAKKYQIAVIQDAAYAALTYDSQPLSFLSVEGAKDVGIEIHSLSKAYNMTGWRIAFVAGNELLLKAFMNVKDNYDSGQFIPIQLAGVTALEHPSITDKIRAKYERRLRELVKVLNEIGFDATMSDGTFFLYMKCPKGTKSGITFKSGEDFSQYLIKEHLISTVPWDDAGAYVRFSATFQAKGEIDELNIIAEVKKRLSQDSFVF
ncbi:MAG: LL-diaminopimelate aminotransferase [Nitrospinae bacterium]|nr:LL-diaminopimelate aminotransferase [Nitrospinota bacterium]